MKRTISILLLFAMLLGLLAGCGGNNSAGNSQQGGSSGGDDGAEKVLVFSRSATISGYDPIVNQTGMNRMLNQLFYENLVTSDYSEDGSYEPELATSWETSEDGLTWTFHLREGVKYTDGNPFGSDDVAGVFNRIFNEEKCATQKKNWAMVDSWECPDELTFVMHLNSTISELNMLTALEGLSIWSNERYEEYGEDMFNFDDTMKPVGTGTFIPDKWTVGSDSEFVRNKEWWGIGVLGEESNVDRLIYRPLTEEATRIAGIQTGELDWVDNVTVEYKERLEGSEASSWSSWITPSLCTCSFRLTAASSRIRTPVWPLTTPLTGNCWPPPSPAAARAPTGPAPPPASALTRMLHASPEI